MLHHPAIGKIDQYPIYTSIIEFTDMFLENNPSVRPNTQDLNVTLLAALDRRCDGIPPSRIYISHSDIGVKVINIQESLSNITNGTSRCRLPASKTSPQLNDW